MNKAPLTIGDRTILLNLDADLEGLTQIQTELYHLCVCVVRLGIRRIHPKLMCQWMNLKSPAPLFCRLEHLAKKEIVEILKHPATA